MYGYNDRQELSISQLEFAYQELKNMTVEERIFQYGFRPDRADVILPAAYIYRFVMNSMGASSIFVPRKGLADGLILKQFKVFK